MQAIVGHINADFDCLGSMIAARYLYPDAVLVLPSGVEKGVHDFISLYGETLPQFTKIKDVVIANVSRLILVDCQQPERIGLLANVLTNPLLSIHIYDHHPKVESSIRGDGGIVNVCGATSTILANELFKKQISISPNEATAILLGIYEDTGNLLFAGTCMDDFQAAGWLVAQGANLQIVAEFVTLGLTAGQISLLDTLLKNLSQRTINDTPVSISFASCQEYIADVSRLAHLMRDMEHLDLLFLVVDMGKSVTIIARSNLPKVDVGKIMRHFGGGGHNTAASASIRGVSLKQLLDKLEMVLVDNIIADKTAASLMSSPVKTLLSGVRIVSAQETLIRYNCTSMPVMKDKTVIGIISRKTVEKALYHGLTDETVNEYMNTEFYSATPETVITDIQKYIVEENQRLVPVLSAGNLVGVVTRTDMLRYLYNGASRQSEALYDVETLGFVTRHTSLEGSLKKHLSLETLNLLQELGAAGDALGLSVYVVGGFVRDLILGVQNFDIDITVEGDGIFFAEYFVKQHSCRLRCHHAFGTAVIIFNDGSKIDVASTRLEYYKSPGVLPTVERSSLRHDLYRRDFTINTLVIALNKEQFGIVTDFFCGRQDLQKRIIKVLHNLSFVEDPSRVFRAIRFEQRLGFSIAPHTEHLIRSTVRMNGLESLNGARIYNELILILKEKEPTSGLQRLATFGLLPSLHPALKMTPETVRILCGTEQVLAWFRLMYLTDRCHFWQVYYLSFTSNLNDTDFCNMLKHLTVPQNLIDNVFGQRRRILHVCKKLQQAIRNSETVSNSLIYTFFDGFAMESLLYVAALAREDEIKRLVSLYLTSLRNVKPFLDGAALMSLGLKPGPSFKKVLKDLLYAKLDGKITDMAQELQLAKTLIISNSKI